MRLDLPTPDVVSYRTLCAALDRAMPRLSGVQRDVAAAHGLSQSDVSRAVRTTYRDTPPLQRLAVAAGYERHPTRPGWYRRIAPNPTEA